MLAGTYKPKPLGRPERSTAFPAKLSNQRRLTTRRRLENFEYRRTSIEFGSLRETYALMSSDKVRILEKI